METSLARRQRHRRNGNGQRHGPGAASRIAIAFPLFLFGSFLLVGLVGFGVVVSGYTVYSQGLADPKTLLDNISFDQQTVVYDSTGKVELARFGQQKRTLAQYGDLPPILVDATTSIEDHTFWENAGFDPAAILKAGLDSLVGRARGASTITQQLVRARLLPDDVLAGPSYERKIKEIIQSIRLTQELPAGDEGKRQILYYYLNQNFYGNQSYGVAAAAKSYFGITDLRKLTLAQAAILAAIPQSPTTFDLVKNADSQTDAAGKPILVVPNSRPIVQRRNLVLEAMRKYRVLTAPGQPGAITDAQITAAEKEPVILVGQLTPNWRAPHFVWQVRKQLGERLCPQDPENCPRIDTGGYVIRTTLDWNMQKVAEKWVQAAVLGPNQGNTASYLKGLKVPDAAWIENLRGKNIRNGALVAIDYRTGKILAYVGSASYYSQTKTRQFQPQFDVLADGWRQPGSAIKPINYVTGFQDGTITPATMFMDVTTDFGGGPNNSAYIPTDADNLERGPIRMRQALMFSLNIPSVKAAIMNGPDHVFDVAKKFGLKFLAKTNLAGSSIGLGTLEIHPLDLVGAYGAIANGGVLMPQNAILSIIDNTGTQIWPPAGEKPAGTQVVSPQSAYLMQDILIANTDPAQNPYWGKFEVTQNGRHVVAGLKTGTTNDTKDLSAYGFLGPPKDQNAPAIAVGVWMGNSDNSKTKGVFSLESTAPLYQAFLNDIAKGKEIGDFPEPSGIVHAKVDAWSGLLPGPFTSRTVDEIFIDGTVPTKVDDTKIGLDIDAASGLRWAEGCVGPMQTRGYLNLSNSDAGFPQWQKADQDWIARARRGAGVAGGPVKPPLKKSATSYFYQPGYTPYGASWGAPFAPGGTCTPGATPSFPPDCPPGSVQTNPDGTLVLGPDGQPIPCPDQTAPPDCPPGSVQTNPDGTLVLGPDGQPIPCPDGSPEGTLPPVPTAEPTPETVTLPPTTPEPTAPPEPNPT